MKRWCLGFVSGFGLFSEHWTRDARTILQIPLGLIFELAKLRGLPDPTYAQLCDVLPEAAAAVYRYWQAQGRT